MTDKLWHRFEAKTYSGSHSLQVLEDTERERRRSKKHKNGLKQIKSNTYHLERKEHDYD